MALTMKGVGSSKDFETCPAGTFTARCYMIVDLGTQEEKDFNTGAPVLKEKIYIGWELLDDEAKMEDGKPFVVGQEYTASIGSKSNLGKLIGSWRGKPLSNEEISDGFNVGVLLGQYCQLTTTHSKPNAEGRIWVNVGSVAPLHKQIPRPDPINENKLFGFDSEDSNAVFEKLPKWIKTKIEKSKEWNQGYKAPENKAPGGFDHPKQPPKPVDSFTDDIPF